MYIDAFAVVFCCTELRIAGGSSSWEISLRVCAALWRGGRCEGVASLRLYSSGHLNFFVSELLLFQRGSTLSLSLSLYRRSEVNWGMRCEAPSCGRARPLSPSSRDREWKEGLIRDKMLPWVPLVAGSINKTLFKKPLRRTRQQRLLACWRVIMLICNGKAIECLQDTNNNTAQTNNFNNGKETWSRQGKEKGSRGSQGQGTSRTIQQSHVWRNGE